MEIAILIIIAIILLGIFSRGGRGRGGLFTRRCPHCRQRMNTRASVCPWCGRDVKPIEFWQDDLPSG